MFLWTHIFSGIKLSGASADSLEWKGCKGAIQEMCIVVFCFFFLNVIACSCFCFENFLPLTNVLPFFNFQIKFRILSDIFSFKTIRKYIDINPVENFFSFFPTYTRAFSFYFIFLLFFNFQTIRCCCCVSAHLS